MDWLQFTASVIASLAWPSAVALSVYILWRPLVGLLPRVKSLKYKDLEVDFGEKLNQVEKQLAAAPPEQLPEAAPQSEESERRFLSAIDFSPNLAVFEAWLNVEAALREVAQTVGLDLRQARTMPQMKLAALLRKTGVIDQRTAALLNDLRELRNLAVHPLEERPISAEEARRYKELADEVVALLKQVRPRPRPAAVGNS